MKKKIKSLKPQEIEMICQKHKRHPNCYYYCPLVCITGAGRICYKSLKRIVDETKEKYIEVEDSD